MQDYGAPIAWRLALADPHAVEGVISQNGNAYKEVFVPEFWEPIWAYHEERSAQNERALRPALERDAVEWQYLHGVPDKTLVDPDAWEHDLALARIKLLDAGHFLLESNLDDVVRIIREWLSALSDPPAGVEPVSTVTMTSP